jgi:hypothetical protein
MERNKTRMTTNRATPAFSPISDAYEIVCCPKKMLRIKNAGWTRQGNPKKLNFKS